MTTEKPRLMLATLAVLGAVGLQALAAAQERRIVPGNAVKTSKPAPAEPHERPAASIGIHGFSVVLVVGGMQAAANPADEARDAGQVPAAARKALADMKDFLPYKRYQLLDASWILCCAPNGDANPASGRVRGPDGRDYLYALDPGTVVASKLSMRFTMRETQEVLPATVNLDKLSDTARLEHSRQVYEALRERDEADLQLRTTKQRFDVGTATSSDLESAQIRSRRAHQRAQDLQAVVSIQTRPAAQGGGGGGRGGSTRTLMDSSFSITLGETVVIGTSRLNGDQALIALLTAAAKPGGAR